MKGSKYYSRQGLLSLSCATLALAFQALVCQGQYTLRDGNSVATIDGTGGTGMNSWTVDGQNQLVSQWFYYRVGSVGANAGLQNVGALSVIQPNSRALYMTYGNAQSPFTVEVDYTMTGGAVGTGTSDIGESIRVQNNSASALDFHFFQYCNFDLGGLANNDTVELFKNPRTGYSFLATQSGGSITLNESVEADTTINPGAPRGEADAAGQTLARLLSGTPYNLDNNLGPVGPGDETWAFQWDKTIDPGGTLLISKDKNISGVLVPEPTALALLSLGLVGWAMRRRGQSA